MRLATTSDVSNTTRRVTEDAVVNEVVDSTGVQYAVIAGFVSKLVLNAS